MRVCDPRLHSVRVSSRDSSSIARETPLSSRPRMSRHRAPITTWACIVSSLVFFGAACGGSADTPAEDLDTGTPCLGDCTDSGGDSAAPACGDGALNPGEGCDDHNTKSGDGCSSTCAVEDGWTCPTPGEPCFHISTGCGDRKVESG